MASTAAKAFRRARARQRLDREVESLAGRLGVDLPAESPATRDHDLAAIVEVERQADILATVNAALVERGIEAPEPVDDEETAPDLKKLTRADLEALAAELGIEEPGDKKRFPNVGVLREAVEAALAAAANETDPSESSEDVEEVTDDTGSTEPHVSGSETTQEGDEA